MENALKNVVYADSFYQCATKRAINSKIHEENRMTVLYRVIRGLGESLKNGTMDELYKSIQHDYRDSWFKYDYIKEQTAKDDISVFR